MARVAGEAGLWGAANLASIGCASGGAWFGASALGFSAPTAILFAALAACVSSTWGSWAALSWTRTRWMWLFALGATIVPGIATLVLGAAAIYAGAAWYLGLLFGAAGLGMIVASMALTGRLFVRADRGADWRTYAASFLLFPLITCALAGLVGALWWGFVSGRGAGALSSWVSALGAIAPLDAAEVYGGCAGAMSWWRNVLSLSNAAVSTLAIALTTTVIPAAVSRGVRELGDSIARRN